MNRIDRGTRRALEARAKQLRIQGQLQGWSRDHIAEEILRLLPEISPLEAYRLATGWTRQQLSQAMDALYEADRLMPPHVSVSEICRWEHGLHLPNAERQRYLTRLYRTRPDRLGFGYDYSPEQPPDEDESGTVGQRPLAGHDPVAPDRPLGILAGMGDRILAVRWVSDDEGGAELVVEVEDGDRDGKAVLRLAGWRAPIPTPARDGWTSVPEILR